MACEEMFSVNLARRLEKLPTRALEISTKSRLAFLETEVKLISNRLHTPTYTNLAMHYTSVCTKASKIGLIDFYLNRALTICSNYVEFKDEISKTINILR